jgi:hypothetical protein
MIYMAKCPSAGCNSFNGAGAVWVRLPIAFPRADEHANISLQFKIAHAGLISGTQNKGVWAGDQIVDTLNWTVTIPKALAPGEYLIRHELLALHQANNPQCKPEILEPHPTSSLPSWIRL